MKKRYTTAEAAAYLGIHQSLVARYCLEGRIGEKIGRNYSITGRELRRFKKLPRRRGNPDFGVKK